MCVCEREIERGRECVREMSYLHQSLLHLCLSVSEGLRQLYGLMCFPDDLGVFTPCTVQSAMNTEKYLTLGNLLF